MGANRKSLFQASTVLLRTTSSRMFVSFKEHCCLADRGMRLRTLPYGMVIIAGEVAVEDEDEDDDVGTVGVESVGIPIVGDLGGLPEPGHLADSGPWLLIKPAAVVERDRRHVAHTVGMVFRCGQAVSNIAN